MGNLTHTVSGDIASFRSAARVPIESLKCYFKPKQDLHGYNNPWPAGGGENIWDEEWEVGRFDTTTGNNVETTGLIRSKNYISVIPENTYYVVTGTNTYIWMICYDINKQVITEVPSGNFNKSGNSFGIGGNDLDKTFTAPIDCYYIRFYTLQSYGGTYLNNIAINKNSNITIYSPYENICSITGWNNINMYTTSGDYKIDYIPGTTTSYNVTFTINNNGVVTASGTPTSYSSCYYGYIDVEGTETLYGTIFGSLNNITWNKPSLFDSNGNLITTTLSDAVLEYGLDLSQFPGVKKVRILLKRNINNIPMSGYCSVVIGKNRKIIPNNIPITFPIIGKNKFNWDVEFVNPDITTTTSASKRIFLPYTYCIGGSYSNYFMPNAIENYNIENGTISVKRKSGYSVYGVSYALPLIKGQTYYLSCTAVSGFIHTAFYDKEGNYLTGSSNNYSNFSFTVPNNSTISVFNFIPSNTTDTATFSNILIELENTATEYTEFSNNNTVYGGYVDIAKGEVVKEYDSYTFTGISDDLLSYYGPTLNMGIDRHIFRSTKLDWLPVYSSTTLAYSNIAIANSTDNSKKDITMYIGTPIHQIIFTIKSNLCENTVESFSAWLSEHPLQIVYKLKEPIHYPLSKTELKTFLDQNNIWSNTNDITEVSYLIHDSNMMLLAKKDMMAENLMHYRKVLWNNFEPPCSTEYYLPYNSNYIQIEDIEDGIIKQTFLVDDKRTYYTSIREKNEYQPLVYISHKYYVSYMLYTPMENTHFGIECFGGTPFDFGEIQANQWTRLSFYGNGKRDGSGHAYLGNIRTYPEINGYALLKSPIYIDLTAMFGLGNEPTKEEFEYLCKINNIDLNKSYPYDSGTELIWCIPDHNKDQYITVEWNQNAKPISSSNYKAYNSEHITVTFEDNMLISTWLSEGAEYSYSACTNYSKTHTVGNYYFLTYEYYTDINGYIGGDVGGVTTQYVQTQMNQWTRYSIIVLRTAGGNLSNYAVYVNRFSNSIKPLVGSICKARNIVAIDLTSMFGAGNEPLTIEELYAICLKNNINIYEALPYNAGTKMIWKL